MLLLAAACSGKQDPDKIAKTARSWQASVDIASKMMNARKIPPRYAKQIADAAEEELTREKSDDAQTRAAIEAARKLRDACERR